MSRGDLWLDEDSRNFAEDQTQRPVAGRTDLHVRGSFLQSGENEKPDGGSDLKF